MPGVEWGSVSSWVAAVVTSSSAMVAVFSYRRSLRDAERKQASQVSAWIPLSEQEAVVQGGISASEPKLTTDRPVERITVPISRKWLEAKIANRSDAPIYNVELALCEGKSKLETVHASEIPPETVGTARFHHLVVRTRTVSLAVGSKSVSSSVTDFPLTLLLSFDDALGRRWRRSPDSRLRRVSSHYHFGSSS
jgi:hypothetical protein